MSQEAIMIAVDNSDYMRNGDYSPNRLQCQIEAFNYFTNAKKIMNVENTCGLITLSNYQVLSTLTTDMFKLQNKIKLIDLSGNINFSTTVRVSQLALRHRQNRNQKPRIVVFAGSPISEDESELVNLAKKLKKEKVNIDVISFGEIEENQQKLITFIDIMNGKDGSESHLVTIPAGTSLQDSLRTSPILMNEEDRNLSAVGVEMEEIDDPDLLYALRMSMEDQFMQQGRAMERLENVNVSGDTGVLENLNAEDIANEVDFANLTEEEQIAFAMQMSLQDDYVISCNYAGDEIMDTTVVEDIQKDYSELKKVVFEDMEQDEDEKKDLSKGE